MEQMKCHREKSVGSETLVFAYIRIISVMCVCVYEKVSFCENLGFHVLAPEFQI